MVGAWLFFVNLRFNLLRQLQDNQNNKIDSKEYLEKALEESKAIGEIAEQKNKLRR